MIKNLVITYTGGSCGDFVSIPFVNTQKFYSPIISHSITSSGQALPLPNADFIKNFPKQPGLHHYSRDWSNDLDKLKRLSTPFLILTTDTNQATMLKNCFNDDLHVLAINYNVHNWSFVAKNFCKKVLNSPNYLTRDDVGERFLTSVSQNSRHREQFLYLGSKGVLGQWYAKHLALGNLNHPPKENIFLGDTVLLVDEILEYEFFKNKIISVAEKINVSLDIDAFLPVYNAWRCRQFQFAEIDKALLAQGLSIN